MSMIQPHLSSLGPIRLYQIPSILNRTLLITDWPDDHEMLRIGSMPYEDKLKIKLLLGHFGYNTGLHLHFPGEVKYVTFLREPVSRMLSYHHYLKKYPGHWLSAAARKKG